MLSHFSPVQRFATKWIVAHQAALSMGFSRQEYWSGLSFSSAGDLPSQGLNLDLLHLPALARGFFTTSATWEAQNMTVLIKNLKKYQELAALFPIHH